MEIYLFHWLIINGLGIVQAIVHSTLPAWLFVCAVYVLTLSAAVLYHRFIAPRIEALERKVVSQL